MSPYRSTPASNRVLQIRLAEPIPGEALLSITGIFTPMFLVGWASGSDFGTCFAVSGFVLAVLLFLACRHRAWVVMMPREERVRVVRLHGFSYSASTLRLNDATSVECSPVGSTMWLFVVAKDGRAARVIPAAPHMLERLQSAIEEALRSSDIRRGTPSPR